MGWQENLKRMIAAQAKAAYKKANPKKGAKYVPYVMPEIAVAMTECLNRDDEYEAKRLMGLYRRGCVSLL
jgi:hypothetical protein